MRTTHLLAALLVTAATVVLVTGCGSKVTKSNFDKIKDGMTADEVKNILGDPTEEKGAGIAGIGSGKIMTWADGGKKIVVTFANDKVTAVAQENL